MKKGLKIVLIIFGILIGIIILDTIQALIFNNNVIIGIETKCRRKEGILVDTYHCGNGENISKLKKSNVCYYDDVCGVSKSKSYTEIKESIKKATEWCIKAQYPKCVLSEYEDNPTASNGSSYDTSFLINNGYIKKSELLDIDGQSYCDTHVRVRTFYENQFDHQNNCKVSYKIYLKCKDYEDKGY